MRPDGGFAAPVLFESFEAERLEYVVGMGKYSVLKRLDRILGASDRAAPTRATPYAGDRRRMRWLVGFKSTVHRRAG